MSTVLNIPIKSFDQFLKPQYLLLTSCKLGLPFRTNNSCAWTRCPALEVWVEGSEKWEETLE